MAGVGFWTGMEKTTGNLAQTGMGLLQFKQTQEHQRAIESINRDRLAIERATANRQKEEYDRQKVAYDKPMDIKTHPLYLSLPESAQQKALMFFASNKYTDETGIGKAGDIMMGTGIMEKTKPVFADIMGDVVKAKYQGVIAAWNNFKTIQVKGDPKKTAEARAQFESLNADYQASAGNFTKHIGMLTEQEEKEELERIRGLQKTWEPKQFVGPDGAMKWISPGQPIPEGWIPYEKATEGKGTWSEPYNLGGATVQKNTLTGEIRTAVTRPPGEGKDTTFDKMRGSAIKVLIEEGNKKPTEAQIVKKQNELYKQMNPLYEILQRITGGGPEDPLGLIKK